VIKAGELAALGKLEIRYVLVESELCNAISWQ